jgi:hypothetical protein
MDFFHRRIMAASVGRIASVGVGVGVSAIAGALAFRQSHLRSSPIVEAAAAQLTAADAVRQLLGSGVSSTAGSVGGYMDPIQGTAVLTMPVVSEHGVHALARVEAEAEWVMLEADAKNRGEEIPAPMKSESCRWLLRHLEVQLVDTPAEAEPVTLYSLPKHVPLSVWAPSREPSRLPHWLRAMLPEPSAITQSESFPRLVLVAVVSVSLHFFAFMALHKRMVAEKALRRAESLLALPETPTLQALTERALQLAGRAKGMGSDGSVVQQSGAVLYGKTTSSAVMGFTAINEKRELFFQAERAPAGRAGGRQNTAGKRADDWVITHVAVGSSSVYATRLAKLPDSADAEDILQNLVSASARPLDLGTLDRRVTTSRPAPAQ